MATFSVVSNFPNSITHLKITGFSLEPKQCLPLSATHIDMPMTFLSETHCCHLYLLTSLSCSNTENFDFALLPRNLKHLNLRRYMRCIHAPTQRGITFSTSEKIEDFSNETLQGPNRHEPSAFGCSSKPSHPSGNLIYVR